MPPTLHPQFPTQFIPSWPFDPEYVNIHLCPIMHRPCQFGGNFIKYFSIYNVNSVSERTQQTHGWTNEQGKTWQLRRHYVEWRRNEDEWNVRICRLTLNVSIFARSRNTNDLKLASANTWSNAASSWQHNARHTGTVYQTEKNVNQILHFSITAPRASSATQC